MHNEESSGTIGTGQPLKDVVRPKHVDINEVNNGFTIRLRGGESKDSNLPFCDEYVASNAEEAIKIAQEHLS